MAPSSQKKIAVLVFFIVLIVGGGFYAVNYWKNYNKAANTGSPVKFRGAAIPSAPISLRGTFYLSLVPSDSSAPAGIYSYSLDKQQLQSVLVGDNTKNTYFTNMSPSISPDKSIMAFARRQNNNAGAIGSYQIFTSNLSGKNINQITYARGPYKREPVFSRDGNYLAYVAENASSSLLKLNYEIPNNWSVYITDMGGNVSFISNGLRPVFSPDGKKLLVMRSDGLHLFNIENLKAPKDLGIVAKAIGEWNTKAMKVIVSQDGSMLAWASPHKGNLVVYKINSWDKFSLFPLMQISARAYWPVFSPDGKYLAVDEVRKNITGKDYSVIFVYDLQSGESKKAVNLDGYDYAYLWFGAWIY